MPFVEVTSTPGSVAPAVSGAGTDLPSIASSDAGTSFFIAVDGILHRSFSSVKVSFASRDDSVDRFASERGQIRS